jgi:branched-chain amino acid transport system substrate-binding protein
LFKEYYPRETMSLYHLLGIASAQVVVEALKRTGKDLTRENFMKQFSQINMVDSAIYPGPITCTPEDHQCHKTAAWVQLVNGRITTVATTTVKR